ncbi:MAG: hypothetical protein LPK07_04245 [Hymenobacteraceae bacterium]|nr:hypothetical protein [Hymenobacteraceae bacterium]
MNRNLAQVVSVVFHPLLMPTYLFALILYYMPVSALSLPMSSRWMVLGLIFFTTFIIPGLGAYTMVRVGHLDSLEMDKREQRRLPFLFTGLCYAITAYLLYRETVFDDIFHFIMVIISASVFLAYFISLIWKVSAHSIGVGGALGLLLVISKLLPEAFMLGPIIVAIFLSGLVLSARLALHAHTPAQVYTGFLSGLMLSVIAAFIALT